MSSGQLLNREMVQKIKGSYVYVVVFELYDTDDGSQWAKVTGTWDGSALTIPSGFEPSSSEGTNFEVYYGVANNGESAAFSNNPWIISNLGSIYSPIYYQVK